MKKFDGYLFTFLCWVCGALMLVMMCVIFSQVVARYMFGQSLTWSEEVGRYVFVWIAFLGLAAAFRAKAHVALDLLPRYLASGPSRVLELLNGLLIVVFSSAVLAGGLGLVELGMRQKSPALKLPMQYVYIVVPVSGALLLYFSLRALWTRFQEDKED